VLAQPTVPAPKEIPMKAELKREGNRVWLEPVERLAYPDTFNSLVACLTKALRALGEDVTYEYVMGASGAAFRVQVMPTGPCPCAPHANLGFRCQERAVAALGYDVAWRKIVNTDPESVRAAREAAVTSIDKGVPVLWSSEECGLLVGYENGGEKWLCRTYWDKAADLSVRADWPWELGILSRKERAPDRRAALLGSLETAVEMSRAGEVRLGEKDGKLMCGFPAYETWTKWLLDESQHVKADQPQRKGDLGNAWCYDNLVDSRTAAGKYLRSVRGDFKPETAGHLVKAANLYAQIEATLRAAWKNAPHDWQQKEGESWTSEMRQAEAAALTEALAAEGIKPPVVIGSARDHDGRSPGDSTMRAARNQGRRHFVSVGIIHGRLVTPAAGKRHAIGKVGVSRSSSAGEGWEQPADAYSPEHGDALSKEVPCAVPDGYRPWIDQPQGGDLRP
jgi:hypothetical protein